MAKLIDRGSARPDDPIYNGDVELFTKREFKAPAATPNLALSARTISVDWSGCSVNIDVTADIWQRIEQGTPVTCEVLDSLDELEYRWLFNSEPGYSLIVDFGDPNHLRWLGQLSDAIVTSVDVD